MPVADPDDSDDRDATTRDAELDHAAAHPERRRVRILLLAYTLHPGHRAGSGTQGGFAVHFWRRRFPRSLQSA